MRSEGVHNELLAPLTASRSALSMLLAGDLGKLTQQQQEYLQQLLQLDDYMIDLVTNWADIERLQRGQLALHIEPCNINAIAKIKARRDIMVLADPARLRQILTNMRVAIKGGELRARISSGSCVITLHSPVVLHRNQRKELLRGIQLQVAKLLAEAHNGALLLDPHSRAGTNLRLHLPLAQQISLLGDIDE